MRRELSEQEIIRAGRAQETRAAWERACEFTRALYGRAAARVTYSQTTFAEEDHRLSTTQVLAFDAAGRLMPFDFAAPWWAGRDLPDYVLASPRELTEDGLASGLGGGFPDAIRDDLRAFAEDRLGVETLHTWHDRDESATLTWMFDLMGPPSAPYGAIADDAGATLPPADVVQAGLEREARARWIGARAYVRTLYGERAVRADVSAFSRYNDFTYDRDIRLDVCDAAGTRLFYDLRLPWWGQFAFSEYEIASYAARCDPAAPAGREFDAAHDFEVTERARAEIERLATRLLRADFIATRRPWDTDTTSHDLTQPPALRFPRLWAEGDG